MNGVVSTTAVATYGTIRGTAPYARFGSSLLSVHPAKHPTPSKTDRRNNTEFTEFTEYTELLFVGAPYHDTDSFVFDGRELGAVYAFDAAAVGTNATTSAACWAVTGTRPRARLGVSLAFLGGGAVVGSPLALTEGRERAGAVDLFVREGGG